MSCIAPIQVKHVDDHGALHFDTVPCGSCPECLRNRAADWSFRLLQQDRVSSSSYFVTLTYDTDHVPITNNGFMSLSRRDVQLYFKRLRKIDVNGIKYYVCGEYGGRTRRPHYHAIIFNVADSDHIVSAWKLEDAYLGVVHIGAVSGASVSYTANYVNKPRIVPMHKMDDRVREFSFMSKNLGLSYISKSLVDYYKSDLSRLFVLMPSGWKHRLPRYYKEKIFSSEELVLIREYQKLLRDSDRPPVLSIDDVEGYRRRFSSNALKRVKV